MMTLLPFLLACFLLFPGQETLASIPSSLSDLTVSFRNADFGPHSGDVILLPTPTTPTTPDEDGLVFLQSNDPQLLIQETGTLEATHLFDVFSRAQGLPPRSIVPSPHLQHPASSSQRLLPNTVDRSLLILIPGVGSEELRTVTTTASTTSASPTATDTPATAIPASFAGLSQPKTFQYEALPKDSIALTTSISTGTYPREHGITGKTFRAGLYSDELLTAFDYHTPGSRALPRTISFADSLSLAGGVALSLSSDPLHAKAHCAAPGLVSRNARKTLCVHRDPQRGHFLHALGSSRIWNSNRKLQRQLRQAAKTASGVLGPLFTAPDSGKMHLSLQHDINGNLLSLTLHRPSMDPVVFLAAEEADMAIFAELLAVELLGGEIPETFAHVTVSFAALERLQEAGASAEKLQAVLQILDICFPRVLETLTSGAESHLLAVVFPGHPTPSLSSTAGVDLELPEEFSRILIAAPEVTYPQLYAYLAHKGQVGDLCRFLQGNQQQEKDKEKKTSSSDASGVTVLCPDLEDGLLAEQRAEQLQAETDWEDLIEKTSESLLLTAQFELMNTDDPTPAPTDDPTPAPTDDPLPEPGQDQMVEIRRYQIALWLSVILGFAVIFAAYAVGNMSFRKDTILYGGVQADIAARGAEN